MEGPRPKEINMAIREVKTEKFVILGKDYRAQIIFDSEREVFRIKFPKYVKDVVTWEDASGKTLAEAREEWDRIIKEYGERVATRRKVILFTTKAEVRRQDPDPGEDRGGSRWNVKEFDYEGILKIRFFVGYETTKGDEKEYKDELGHRPDQHFTYYGRNIGDDVKVIDWTQEREDFFRSLIDTIERAKERMDTVFGFENVHELTANIDRIAGGNLIGFDGGQR